MIYQKQVIVNTIERCVTDITAEVQQHVTASQISTGLCHLFIQHTSASLMLCENCDLTVRSDLEAFMLRTIPDGDPIFKHTMEGPDDMPAHVRTVLTHSDLSIPISVCVKYKLSLAIYIRSFINAFTLKKIEA